MLALKQGYEVSGSDIAWSSFVDGLQEAGALLHTGHSVANIHGSGASRLPEAAFVCNVRRSSCVNTSLLIVVVRGRVCRLCATVYMTIMLIIHQKLVQLFKLHARGSLSSLLWSYSSLICTVV
ncbi:uncharacterized protein LOC126628634 isoform X2 [Malus sylvestris]|uniref:uncharacterized protein LOC126628634 isoform X2 n=1 Tax=Malus sylvestris TaxID=3752 RepID=UPI0021ABA15E|nr:uncharacterized protein LOC126628634 isoform X2 [Malus sylvestris]